MLKSSIPKSGRKVRAGGCAAGQADADVKNAKRSKKIAPRSQKKLPKMEKCGAQNVEKPPEKSKIYGIAEVSEKSKARQADAKKAKRSEGIASIRQKQLQTKDKERA